MPKKCRTSIANQHKRLPTVQCTLYTVQYVKASLGNGYQFGHKFSCYAALEMEGIDLQPCIWNQSHLPIPFFVRHFLGGKGYEYVGLDLCTMRGKPVKALEQ